MGMDEKWRAVPGSSTRDLRVSIICTLNARTSDLVIHVAGSYDYWISSERRGHADAPPGEALGSVVQLAERIREAATGRRLPVQAIGCSHAEMMNVVSTRKAREPVRADPPPTRRTRHTARTPGSRAGSLAGHA